MNAFQKGVFLAFLAILLSIPLAQNQIYGYEKEYDFTSFVDWAYEHHIYLVGVNKSSEHLIENGFNPYSDRADLSNVSSLMILENTLTNLPDYILDSLHGKTIYISTQEGRSMIIPNSQSIENMNPGIILEQKITKYYILHEIGHMMEIVSNHSDKFDYKKQDVFSINYSNIQEINNRPKGYITYYSLVNQHENFAEHFAHYVTNGEGFRKQASNDSILQLKYDFLKQYVFDGMEY